MPIDRKMMKIKAYSYSQILCSSKKKEDMLNYTEVSGHIVEIKKIMCKTEKYNERAAFGVIQE